MRGGGIKNNQTERYDRKTEDYRCAAEAEEVPGVWGACGGHHLWYWRYDGCSPFRKGAKGFCSFLWRKEKEPKKHPPYQASPIWENVI